MATGDWRGRLRRLVPLLIAGTLIGSALTLVAFSVPLYRLFCAATGLGGQTVRVDRNTTLATDRVLTVRFSTDVAPGLDWRFVPEQTQVTVRLGEQALVYFRALNRSTERIVGHATFNVTPYLAGPYFNKIQCFCFEEEALEPGQSVEMPVVFFVDPAFAKDPDTAALQTITLAYTFFRSANARGCRPSSPASTRAFPPTAPPTRPTEEKYSRAAAAPATPSMPTAPARAWAACSAAPPAPSRPSPATARRSNPRT